MVNVPACATFERTGPSISANKCVQCRHCSHSAAQDDDAESSFCFVTRSIVGSHLIPNSDCTPSGYHERCRVPFQSPTPSIKLARASAESVTVEQVRTNFVLASKDTIKSTAASSLSRESERARERERERQRDSSRDFVSLLRRYAFTIPRDGSHPPLLACHGTD